MSMESKLLITVASWEDRFLSGTKWIIENDSIGKIVIFYFKEYIKWSSDNISEVETFAKKNSIKTKKIPLSFATPVDNWNGINSALIELKPSYESVLLDFTTMPRSIIWYVLFFLHHQKFNTNYIYHKAGSYNCEWLSRNPDKPKLVYKLSGITRLGRPLLLVVFTGYDPERVENLISYFEPQLVRMFVQDSKEYDNRKYLNLYQSSYRNRPNCEIIGFDAFHSDHGYQLLEEEISPFIDTHNIIFASLGPKPSAIALFRFVIKNVESGLCYVPSKEFNKKYSSGIGDSLSGALDF